MDFVGRKRRFRRADAAVPLGDGCYPNLLTDRPVAVKNRTLHTDGAPIIIRISEK